MDRMCQALVIREGEDHKAKLVKESISAPVPGPGQALVRVKYVSQNPTDVKSMDWNIWGDGHVIGCDFCGTVEEIGCNVSKISKGDAVAGLVWGGEIKGLGAYSEYAIADEHICYKVPEGISGAAASSVPLACTTAWLALFAKTCLNIDRNGQKSTVLVWGGSSSVGLYAVQLAVIYGIKVITTCSPRNADLLRSLGAQHVFDYREENVIKKIRAAAPDIHHIFDTVGDSTSSLVASKALAADAEGFLCTVQPGKAFTEHVARNVQVSGVMVWTAFLKDHSFGEFVWPASKDDHELCSELFEKLPSWLESGKLEPNRTKIFEGGLDAVSRGFQEFRDGKVSGYKIVYQL